MKRVFLGLSLVIALISATVAVAERPGTSAESVRKGGCGATMSRHAPEHAQEHAMRCLINKVRARSGVGQLASHRALERAAGGKVGDILRCGFSHTACGHAASHWARRTGYIGGGGSYMWGENLARGKRRRGTARKVLRAWLGSGPHRNTMLTGAFEHVGIGLKGGGERAVWVLQVGCHGC